MSQHTKPGMVLEYWQAVRAFSPSLRLFLLSIAMTTLTFFGILSVLQNLFLLRLGFDARFIGLLLGTGQIVWAAAALPAGLLSNHIGLRNGPVLGLVIAGLGLTLMLLVESRPEVQWRAWLLGSQGLITVGVACITVNMPPYIMAMTGEQERRYAFAVLASLIPATAFLGSLIAGVLPGLFAGWFDLSLDQPGPYRLALWSAPVLLYLAILPLLGADPARIPHQDQQLSARGSAPISWLLFFGLFVFLQMIGEGAIRSFFNVYLDTALSVPTAQIGTIMGMAQLLPIIAALSAALLIARFGTAYALAAATLGMGLCLLPLVATSQVWVASLAFMGVITMTTIAGTTRDLFGQEMVIPRWRTTSQSVAIIGLALGWATAGLMGGYLIESYGFGAMFIAGVISALLATLLLSGFLLRRRMLALPKPSSPAGDI